MSDPFSEDDVLDLVQMITNDPPFKDRDVEYENRRDLLYQRRFVSIPGVTIDAYGKQRSGMVQFRSPEIEDDAHSFKNRMLASPLKINVAALKKSEKAQASAQAQEDFFYRHYYRWRDQGIFDPVLFDQASMGIGWCHLALNTEVLPIVPEYEGGDDQFFQIAQDELEEFTKGEKPDLFVLEPIDANTMYWSPDHKMIINKAKIPLNPLVTLYGTRGKQITVDEETGYAQVTTLAPGQNVQVWRTNWSTMITLYTLEDEEFCYHVLPGALLGCYKNIFKRPGFFKCIGEQTSSSDPLYAYRPLLQGKYQTVPVKNLMVTAMTTGGMEGAQQRWTLEPMPGTDVNDDNSSLTVSVDDNGIIQPPAGYKLVNAGLALGPDLPNALKTIQLMDTYGYPKALGNPQEVTANSGYDRARIQDAVSSLLDPPLSHFSTMLTDIFKALLSAVSEIDLPITVRSVEKKMTAGGPVGVTAEATIRPEDVQEETDIGVSFNSISMFSRLSEEEEGLKMMQADMMTETEFITQVRGVDDLAAWRQERMLDKIYKNSDDRAVAMANQLIDQIAEAAKQQVIQQNNLPQPTPQMPSPMVSTNGQTLRSDRGPAIPIGAPGASIPAGGPTPPGPAELGGPDMNTAGAGVP